MATGSLDWGTVQRDVEERIRHKPADDVKKKIVIPSPVPAGNHLAHFIRSIHWNSKGMLPSTAGSQRSYDKYNTVTKLSFQGPENFRHEQQRAKSGVSKMVPLVKKHIQVQSQMDNSLDKLISPL